MGKDSLAALDVDGKTKLKHLLQKYCDGMEKSEIFSRQGTKA